MVLNRKIDRRKNGKEPRYILCEWPCYVHAERERKYIIFEKLELGHNCLGPSCVYAAA
jgi:hypothetical protein